MEKVIERLKMYKNQIDMAERFNFSIDNFDSILDTKERERLFFKKSPFYQNIQLKEILKEKYEKTSNTTPLDFWIINEWGGIRGFKANDRNQEKIRKFREQLIKRKLTLDSFSTISSLSKLSSFIDPDNFVIYDSRVIFTINWLILTCENQNNLKIKYYPMPNGRNKIISDFDMNTIINVVHVLDYHENSLFIHKQQAYFNFCDFIKSATKEIFDKDTKPYQLEMLLFTLADKEIFNEIKNRLKISL
ncbi:MAG: hypothetical protein DSY77_05090 [Bacteroidetes bacterium]|nr:MAG: hypothetical protein DSY77_05090 [Bacteroidota bacterium]